ncbi:MAG: DegQ family serine endoprotease [Syntrophobacteraceae bacterium]
MVSACMEIFWTMFYGRLTMEDMGYCDPNGKRRLAGDRMESVLGRLFKPNRGARKKHGRQTVHLPFLRAEKHSRGTVGMNMKRSEPPRSVASAVAANRRGAAETAVKIRRNQPKVLKVIGVVALLTVWIGLATIAGWGAASTAFAAAEGVAAQSAEEPPAALASGMGLSFAPLVDKLSPSVVNVKVTKIETTQFRQFREFRLPNGQADPFGDFFQKFFGENGQMQPRQRVQGAGSGVIISPDGYILTNNHVVDGAKDVKVTLEDKREYSAEIIGCDPKTDLAVLKIKAGKELPAARLGDSEKLRVGDQVIAIGNPFGLDHTVTSGIVSAKGRVIGAGPYDDFIQTDASINPGNSGGPLFDMTGAVVGINTAIIPNGQGIGFAIPIDTAKALIPQLEENGEVTRGYIGVNIQSMSEELAKAMGLKNHSGALVADVVPDGPSDKAGVKRGDVIIAFNGKEVKDSHDLPAIVAATAVGDKAEMTVLRDGKEMKIQIKVAKLAADEARPAEKRATREKWGMTIEELTPQIAQGLGVNADQGAVITDVEPGSPADRASLRRGDVIVEVNRHPVKSVQEARDRMTEAEKSKGSMLLLVQRDKGKFYAALEKQQD